MPDTKAGSVYIELRATTGKLMADLSRAQAALTGVAAKLTTAFRSLGKAVSGLGGHIARLGTSIQSIAGSLRTYGLIGTAAAALVTRQFAAFDDVMRQVGAVSGATGSQFEALQELALELGRTTSYTAAQVAGGMLEMSRAGFSVNETLAATPGLLNLARAGAIELSEAVSIASGTLRGLGLPAAEIGRVADVLVAATNASAQTLTDMGGALKYAVPWAAQLGLSIDDLAKSIAYLANVQIRGAMSGTGIRAVLVGLASPRVQKAVKKLGLDLQQELANPAKDLITIMRKLGVATENLPAPERLSLFAKLFGARGAPAAMVLATMQFESIDEAMADSAGRAAEVAKQMDAGIGGTFRRLASALEGIWLAIGRQIASVLGPVVEYIQGRLGVVTAWVQRNAAVVLGIAAIGPAALAAAPAMMALGKATQLVGTAFTAASNVAQLAVMAFGALPGPLRLVVLAFAAASAMSVDWTDAGGTIMRVLGRLKATLFDVTQTVTTAWPAIVSALQMGDIESAWEIGCTALQLIWRQLIVELKTAWANFVAWFKQSYPALESLYDMLVMLHQQWQTAGKGAKTVLLGSLAGVAELLGYDEEAKQLRIQVRQEWRRGTKKQGVWYGGAGAAPAIDPEIAKLQERLQALTNKVAEAAEAAKAKKEADEAAAKAQQEARERAIQERMEELKAAQQAYREAIKGAVPQVEEIGETLGGFTGWGWSQAGPNQLWRSIEESSERTAEATERMAEALESLEVLAFS